MSDGLLDHRHGRCVGDRIDIPRRNCIVTDNDRVVVETALINCGHGSDVAKVNSLRVYVPKRALHHR